MRDRAVTNSRYVDRPCVTCAKVEILGSWTHERTSPVACAGLFVPECAADADDRHSL